jgi:multiple sugar transport system permease protein/raffinose/stachyose/melibiose transport system permease protein
MLLPGRRRVHRAQVVRNAALTAICLLVFYPFLMLIQLSVKDHYQVEHRPWWPELPFLWDNYAVAWATVSKYVFNSILVSGVAGIGMIAVASLAAYVFARQSFPGRELLYNAVIALMMVPGILTLIPLFILVKDLGLLDSYSGLILPYIAGGQVFGIFLLRQFFAGLPEELFEAARIDGAGELTILLRIVVPLSWPILGTLAIIHILYTWNDLIWPLVVISDQGLKTLTIGLLVFRGSYIANWGPLFAGYFIATVPLLLVFVFANRLFIRGLTSGALKM